MFVYKYGNFKITFNDKEREPWEIDACNKDGKK